MRQNSIFLKKRPYKKKKLEPKPCLICGNYFQPFNNKSRLCQKEECRREDAKIKNRIRQERKMNELYAHGRIWILDMATWEWHLEVRP